ncbi:MAG: 16S rRNA (guanine(527)-N(7))-methyltransferase RsmG [Clostridia bacterium]
MNNKDIEKIGFKEVLKYEAKQQCNILLNDLTLDRLEKYKNLLLEWNEKINLTAITDEYEIIIKHFIDCLQCTKYIQKGSNIIDVGTGAGFPGVVISIFFENNINVTLLDSLNKRLVFLEEIIKKTNLKNVTIIHARAEEAAKETKHREHYDVVVSRAVASLQVLLEYTTPYLKIGGKAILMKSNSADQEINDSKKALEVLQCKIFNVCTYVLEVGSEVFTRKIIIVEKLCKTPKSFPRIYGKIKKSPL